MRGLEPRVPVTHGGAMSPELAFWSGLVLKMALTATVVVVTSVVVERSGSFLGALIASLPTAAGAAYIILAVERPRSFIAASAVGSIASAATVSVFCATYTLLAQRRGLVLSRGVAILAWFAAAAVFAVAIPLSARYRAVATTPKFLRTKFDIPLRALAAALVVVIVTTARYSIGSFA
jgi:uncharacterized membrane protein (GlpM family)